MRLEGSCHCGKVRFRCEADAPVPFLHCYCSICRKTAGAGQRHFCTGCGSALWLFDPDWPDLVHPHASAIDTSLPTPPERVHMLLGSKANWVQVPDGAAPAARAAWRIATDIRMPVHPTHRSEVEDVLNKLHSQTAHSPPPTSPDGIPGQVPNPGRDPIPDQPVDPIPDQPADPTIPPIRDPVPGEAPDEPPIRDPDPHPQDPPRR